MPGPDAPDPYHALPLRYRLALRLLPAHVRDEHRSELHADLAALAPSTGVLIADMLRAAPRAHWDVLRQDVTVAFRQMRRARGFATIAIVTLALGIGGNVALFSLVDNVLLEQLPIAGADRIVSITEENIARGMRNFGMAPGNFRDLTLDSTVFAASTMYGVQSATVHMAEDRERVIYATAGGDFFRIFRAPPLLGRALTRDDDVPGADVLVLSYSGWRQLFGGAVSAVGRNLEVNGVTMRVIGVMPESFSFPDPDIAFWRPLGLTRDELEQHGARSVRAAAELKPGVSIAQAAAAMEVAGRALAAKYPRTNGGWSVRVRELRASQVEGVRPILLLIWGAGGLVFLIAVANVASLFLTRAVMREREVALRTALGARGGRVIRQLVTESLVLASLSAAAGVGFAALVLRIIVPLAAGFVPRVNEVSLDSRVIAYAVVLTVLTTALLSVLATGPVRRKGVWSALGTGRASMSRRQHHWQRAIVVSEIALAVCVAVAAGLGARGLQKVLGQPMGFDRHDALTFRVEPPWRFDAAVPMERLTSAMNVDRQRAARGYTNLLAELEQLPGVRAAGAINRLPLTGDWWSSSIRLPERPQEPNAGIPVYVRPVTPGYFAAMGTRVVEGRDVLATDVAGAENVIVVDREFTRRVWPGSDPIGREVLVDGPPGENPRARVVGVVETMHMNRLDGDVRSTMYVPLGQSREGHYLDWGMDVVLRGNPRLSIEEIRRVVQGSFPDAVVFGLETMDALVEQSTAGRRFQLMLLAAFGGFSVFLAALGVGGVLLLNVRERRGALAVQMALGATRGRVWRTVQRDGVVMATSGAAIGIGAALAGAGVFSSVVYEISVRDPVAFVGAPVLLVLAANLAAAVAAWRAMEVDPAVVLRE